MNKSLLLGLVIVALTGVGTAALFWWLESGRNRPSGSYPGGYNYATPAEFKDDVTTNFQVTPDKLALDFLDRDGKVFRLRDYHGKKNVALIIMRGLTKDPGGICPSCSAQTSRLVTNYPEFARRDTEVLVVYPGSKEQVAQFVSHIRGQVQKEEMPFPVLLDEGFQVVDRLGIRGDQARPSTFLIDKDGQIRFAYVGETTTDRPSLKAIYQQLDALARAGK